jgi:hypothetical protein
LDDELMRRLVALLLLQFTAPVWLPPLALFPAWALVSIVQDAPQHGGGGGGITKVCNAHGSGVSNVATNTVDCTGATLIVLNASFAVAPSSYTDSASNTYSSHSTCGFNPDAGCIWYKYAPTGTLSSLSFTANGSNIFGAIEVIGFSGTTGSAIDQDSGQGFILAASTTCQANNPITPSAGAVVVTGVSFQNDGGGQTYSVDSGVTLTDFDPFVGGTSEGGGIGFLVTSSSIQPTWTDTAAANPAACTAVSFQ